MQSHNKKTGKDKNENVAAGYFRNRIGPKRGESLGLSFARSVLWSRANSLNVSSHRTQRIDRLPSATRGACAAAFQMNRQLRRSARRHVDVHAALHRHDARGLVKEATLRQRFVLTFLNVESFRVFGFDALDCLIERAERAGVREQCLVLRKVHVCSGAM
ncbi:hypothetical protein SB783_18200 [Paraburkholderia sp. SIMBA_009]